MKVWIAHHEGLATMGQLPEDTVVEVYTGDGEYPSDPADVDFWVPPFLATGSYTKTIADLSAVRVIQLLSAGAEVWVPVIPDEVTLCDAMGVHTASTSEWAVTAILASLRGFDHFARAQQRREWQQEVTQTLENKQVLIVGAGDIGTSIARKVAAFDAQPVLVARRAREGVHGVEELAELLPRAEIVVLIIPLTPWTRGMVDADFLSRMSDGALLVNAARGPVVATDALIAETRAGRLRAALDVTDPEPLPVDNPLWTFPNVLITPHVGGTVDDVIDKAYDLVGRQLRRFAAGQPLHNVVSPDGY